MSLSKEALKELENEAKELEVQASAIRKLVAKYKNASVPLKHEASDIVENTRSREGGVRDTIRKVLGGSSEGLRPTEVADRMVQLGFQYAGKTPIKQVVSGELARMAKSNQLKKKNGAYSLNI